MSATVLKTQAEQRADAAYREATDRREALLKGLKAIAQKAAQEADALIKGLDCEYSDFQLQAAAKARKGDVIAETANDLNDVFLNACDLPDADAEADAARDGTHWTREAAE